MTNQPNTNYWMNRVTEEKKAEAAKLAAQTDNGDEWFAVALVAGWIAGVLLSWFKSQPLDGGSWWMFGAGVVFFTFFVTAAWRDPRCH